MQMNAPGVCHTQKSTHFPTPARGDPRNKGGKNAAEKKTKTTNQRSSGVTLPETNIAPENRSSQKESHLPTIHFQGLC